MQSHFDLFRDSVSVDARLVHGLRQMYHSSKIVLDAPDGTTRYEAQAKSRFGTFRDSANPDTKSVHGLRQTYHRVGSHFGRT